MIRKYCFWLICSLFLVPNANCAFVSPCENDDKVVYIFVHGLGGDRNQVYAYQDSGIIPTINGKQITVYSENGPEVIGNPAVLGQNADIDVVCKQISLACKNQGTDCKIVLVGVSKGAATIINTIGRLSSENSPMLKNIIAAVIESAPANFNDVAYESFFPCSPTYIIGERLSKRISGKVMEHVFPGRIYADKSCVTGYKWDGIQPINEIHNNWGKNINKDMILILVHSKEDKLIHFSHSQRIYDELRVKGFNNLYFIQTEHGEHANVFWGLSANEARTDYYSICKKHGLPYPPKDVVRLNNKTFDLVKDANVGHADSLKPGAALYNNNVSIKKMSGLEKICLVAVTGGVIALATAYKKYKTKNKKINTKVQNYGTTDTPELTTT